MLIVHSQSMDIYRNLAIEEYLMESVTDPGPILFLWRSECAVVVGKNQNPWRECRLDLMRDEGVPLARRISGGGTVYHDAGNLNYCVIVDRTQYREQQAFEMVVWALAPFGIRATRSGTSNLSVDGYKFSGNAFSFRKGRALHHGTLLLNTDLERLNRYLGSMFDGIETHAIRSVPADVVNLGLGMEEVSAALAKSFKEVYGPGGVEECDDASFDVVLLQPMTDRQRSEAWQLSATPRFQVELAGCRLDVVKGWVAEASGVNAAGLKGRAFADVAFFGGMLG